MFEPDHSGTFGWLSALILLVMVGVGLSLLVDRRFELSSNGNQLRVDIEKGTGLLEETRVKHDRALGELTRLEGARNPQAKELARLQEQVKQARERISTLADQVEKLESSIGISQKDFEDYADKYRNHVWMAAIGEKQASITLRDGRRYEDVTFLRVTAVGIEISHRDGRARMDSQDLDASWQERFLWNSSERKALLEGENQVPPVQAAQAPAISKGSKGKNPPPEAVEPSPDPTAANKLRADVLNWNNKVSGLRMQLQEAQSNIGSKLKSPPGSLETWQQRANRLTVELTQAKAKRDMARLKLAQMDPDDPLARAIPTDY